MTDDLIAKCRTSTQWLPEPKVQPLCLHFVFVCDNAGCGVEVCSP